MTTTLINAKCETPNSESELSESVSSMISESDASPRSGDDQSTSDTSESVYSDVEPSPCGSSKSTGSNPQSSTSEEGSGTPASSAISAAFNKDSDSNKTNKTTVRCGRIRVIRKDPFVGTAYDNFGLPINSLFRGKQREPPKDVVYVPASSQTIRQQAERRCVAGAVCSADVLHIDPITGMVRLRALPPSSAGAISTSPMLPVQGSTAAAVVAALRPSTAGASGPTAGSLGVPVLRAAKGPTPAACLRRITSELAKSGRFDAGGLRGANERLANAPIGNSPTQCTFGCGVASQTAAAGRPCTAHSRHAVVPPSTICVNCGLCIAAAAAAVAMAPAGRPMTAPPGPPPLPPCSAPRHCFGPLVECDASMVGPSAAGVPSRPRWSDTTDPPRVALRERAQRAAWATQTAAEAAAERAAASRQRADGLGIPPLRDNATTRTARALYSGVPSSGYGPAPLRASALRGSSVERRRRAQRINALTRRLTRRAPCVCAHHPDELERVLTRRSAAAEPSAAPRPEAIPPPQPVPDPLDLRNVAVARSRRVSDDVDTHARRMSLARPPPTVPSRPQSRRASVAVPPSPPVAPPPAPVPEPAPSPPPSPPPVRNVPPEVTAAVAAARAGDFGRLEALVVEHGPQLLHQWDKSGCTPVTVCGLADQVATLLAITGRAEWGVQLATAVDMRGRNALLRAAEGGNEDLVQMLIEDEGVDVHCVDDDGLTALHVASEHERGGLVELLVDEYSMSLNARDATGRTPMMVAAAAEQNSIVLELLEQGADPHLIDDRHMTALLHAARSGAFATVQLLLQHSADIAQRDKWGHTALHLAAFERFSWVVTSMIEVSGVDVNACDDAGNTTLHTLVWGPNCDFPKAIDASSRKAVAALAAAGANVNAENNDGETPLMLAVRLGHLDWVPVLAEVGGSLSTPNAAGDTPLEVAEAHGFNDVASVLRGLLDKSLV